NGSPLPRCRGCRLATGTGLLHSEAFAFRSGSPEASQETECRHPADLRPPCSIAGLDGPVFGLQGTALPPLFVVRKEGPATADPPRCSSRDSRRKQTG